MRNALFVGKDSSYPFPVSVEVMGNGAGKKEAVMTAVLKNVAVATRLRRDNRDTPQRKCPLVHPDPSFRRSATTFWSFSGLEWTYPAP